MAKDYLKAYEIKMDRQVEREQWNIWKQGVYTYEALCDVSPVLHAFSKKGTKPLPFSKVPYGMEEYEQNKEKREPTEQEKENERMKAQIFFYNLTKKKKKKKER